MKKRIGRLKNFKNFSNQDVIIVGSGPAGSAAAIFCAQRRLRIIIIDGVTRKVVKLERVVIPKELRNTLGIKEKSPLEIFVEGEDIVLLKYQPGGVCALTGEV